MSFGWTLSGTIFELALAQVLFMLAAFTGGGMAGGRSLGKHQIAVLDLALFLLPGLCVVSAGIVLVLHWCGGSVVSYAWYALPLLAASFYAVYVRALARRS